MTPCKIDHDSPTDADGATGQQTFFGDLRKGAYLQRRASWLQAGKGTEAPDVGATTPTARDAAGHRLR